MLTKKDEVLKESQWKKILLIALPFACYNLAQSLYQLIDVSYIAKTNANQITSITMIGILIILINAFASGFAAASTTIIARAIAKKDEESIKNNIANLLLIMLIISAIVVVVGLITINQVLTFLKVDINNSIAKQYYIFSLLLIPLSLVEVAHIAIKRAEGNSTAIILLTIYSIIIKIFLGWLLAIKFNLGLRGVMIAHTIFLLASLVITIHDIIKNKLRLKNFKFQKRIIKEIFLIGSPLALEVTFLQFGQLIFNVLGKKYYNDTELSAFLIANQITNVALSLLIGFGMGVVTLIVQSITVNNKQQAKDIVKKGVIAISILALVMILLLNLLAPILTKLFLTSSLDEAILYLRILSFSLIGWGVYQIATAIFRGYGKTIYNLIASLVRVYLLKLLPTFILFYFFKATKLTLPLTTMISNVVSSLFIWVILYFTVDLYRSQSLKSNDNIKNPSTE